MPTPPKLLTDPQGLARIAQLLETDRGQLRTLVQEQHALAPFGPPGAAGLSHAGRAALMLRQLAQLVYDYELDTE